MSRSGPVPPSGPAETDHRGDLAWRKARGARGVGVGVGGRPEGARGERWQGCGHGGAPAVERCRPPLGNVQPVELRRGWRCPEAAEQRLPLPRSAAARDFRAPSLVDVVGS